MHLIRSIFASGIMLVILVFIGCGSSTSSNPSAPDGLSAAFTFTPGTLVISQTVAFTDTSTGSPTSWSWSFGDGEVSSSQNPTHAYATAGTFSVTLTAGNATGSNSVSWDVIINPTGTASAASFTFAPGAPVTAQTIAFTDTSTGSPTSWSWNFGDGSTSTSQNPTHAYSTAGSFTVTLTAGNGTGASSASQNVTVSQAGTPLSADFSFTPGSPMTAQTITFTDTSTGSPTSWSWNFGDGSTSTSQNPTHDFTTVGTFTVTLTVGNATGSNTVSHSVTVSSTGSTSTFNGNIVLGSPTATSIKANVFSPDQTGTVYLAYGTASGTYNKNTAPSDLKAATPLEMTLTGLSANTRYYYRLYFQATGSSAYGRTSEYSFHTARAAGSSFTFTIQADSHLDENSDLDLYRLTLANVIADAPDFHVDLGDTFMCEKYSAPLTSVTQPAPDQSTVNTRYVYERANFGIVGCTVPLFLVNGNHEGEAGWLNNGTANNLAIWTTMARQQYYVNPVPDGFYSGDSSVTPFVGKRASWYAWQWGNALFVVLDPYWDSKKQASSDSWNLTLGETQYNWLVNTLASSPVNFKFVFIHNLVGGLDGQMRGGIEAAPFFEWGGQNADGTAGFNLKRPGWIMPIHQLLVKYGVTAVFHGHDHLYVKQALDGVVYQEVPQPSAVNFSSGPNLAVQYHYVSGTILSSSGHLRVTVNPDNVTVKYVRAWLPKNETTGRKNAQVDDTWSVGAP